MQTFYEQVFSVVKGAPPSKMWTFMLIISKEIRKMNFMAIYGHLFFRFFYFYFIN